MVPLLLRNTRFIAVAETIRVATGLIGTLVLVRYLSLEQFGLFSFVIATAGLLGVVNDLGLSTLTVRDVSQNPVHLQHYLTHVGSLELLLSIATAGLITLFGLTAETSGARLLFLIFGVRAGFDGMTFYYRAVFRALEVMQYDALVTVIEALLRTIGLFLIVLTTGGIFAVALVYTSASIISFGVAVWILWRFRLQVKLVIAPTEFAKLIKHALPFAAQTALNIIYDRADATLIGFFVGPTATGLYSAAYRLFATSLFLARIVGLSTLPRFAATIGAQDFIAAEKLLTKSIKYLAAIALPISLILIVHAPLLLHLIFGPAYTSASLITVILAVGIVPGFLRMIYASVSLSFNKEGVQILLLSASVALYILLNLIFIPLFEQIGAAVANTLFISGYTFALFVYSRQFLRSTATFAELGKLAISGLLLLVCLVWLPHTAYMDTALSGIAALLMYFAALTLTGYFSIAELNATLRRFVWN